MEKGHHARMIQRRCPNCRSFYEKKLGDCPDCGEERAQTNKWLVTAKLNNHLYGQVARQEKEVKSTRAARQEKPPS